MPLKPRPSSSCRPARMAASAADLVGQDTDTEMKWHSSSDLYYVVRMNIMLDR